MNSFPRPATLRPRFAGSRRRAGNPGQSPHFRILLSHFAPLAIFSLDPPRKRGQRERGQERKRGQRGKGEEKGSGRKRGQRGKGVRSLFSAWREKKNVVNHGTDIHSPNPAHDGILSTPSPKKKGS